MYSQCGDAGGVGGADELFGRASVPTAEAESEKCGSGGVILRCKAIALLRLAAGMCVCARELF